MKTFSARAADVPRKWWIIDAKDQVLGRVAVKAANLLRGKEKSVFTPHVDTGDYLVVINAEKVRVTGRKLTDKIYYWHTGHPGGVKQTTTGERADGTAIQASYTAKYDGKDVQVTGNSQYDTIAIKQVNANTLTDERKKSGGSYKATGRTVVSNGGKMMTTTTKGTNADGKEFTQILVFDKQ